jgi:hypothetical protein
LTGTSSSGAPLTGGTGSFVSADGTSARFHQPPPSARNNAAGVGQAGDLRLNPREYRLLIGYLRGEQDQEVGVAALHLLLREIEADLGRALELNGRFQGVGIILDGAQAVSDVLERRDDGAAMLGHRLIECRLCRPLRMEQ